MLGWRPRRSTRTPSSASIARLFNAGDVFVFYESDQDLYAKARHFDVVVATLWSTPALIAPFAQRHPQKLYVYYVQDYEPNFFPNDAESQAVAPGLLHAGAEHGAHGEDRLDLPHHPRPSTVRRVHRVVPSLDPRRLPSRAAPTGATADRSLWPR